MGDKEKEILDTRFLRKLTLLFESTLDITNRPGYESGKNNHHLLSEKEKYVTKISSTHGRIIQIIRHMEMTGIFLKRYPDKRYLDLNDVTRVDYLKYHMEIFLYKSHSMFEVLKILFNEVYEYGYPEDKCKWINLKSKLKVDNEKVYHFFEAFFASFSKIINSRHVVAHRGRFEDKLDDVTPSELLSKYRDVKDSENMEGKDWIQWEIDYHLKYLLPQLRSERIRMIRETTEISKRNCAVIFECLLDDFERRWLSKT